MHPIACATHFERVLLAIFLTSQLVHAAPIRVGRPQLVDLLLHALAVRVGARQACLRLLHLYEYESLLRFSDVN